jgi:hypothetical protein
MRETPTPHTDKSAAVRASIAVADSLAKTVKAMRDYLARGDEEQFLLAVGGLHSICAGESRANRAGRRRAVDACLGDRRSFPRHRSLRAPYANARARLHRRLTPFYDRVRQTKLQ